MADRLHVACASDAAYAPYCAAMLHSLFQQTAGLEVGVHYLCPPEFPATVEADIRRLAADYQVNIVFHRITDQEVEGLPALRGIRRLVWYRAFLPERLPHLDRILYLDADTLVIDRLEPLWQTDLDGCELAAVRNVIEPHLRSHLATLEMPEAAPYFNSGVLLMNLKVMRARDSSSRILEHARRDGARFIWGDQDAFNAVLWSSYRQLHPRWNCQNSLFFWAEAQNIFGAQSVEEAVSQPAILHFEGPGFAKPWHYLSRHPFRELYWRHLRAIPFPVPREEGRTLRNMIFRLSESVRSRLGSIRRNVLRRLSAS